jgi:hypothetical protein
MTAKEKAEKLFSEYLIFFPEFRNDLEYDYNTESAKTCALIAVDEIIKAIPDSSDDNSPYNHELKYWQEVKQEIEKL